MKHQSAISYLLFFLFLPTLVFAEDIAVLNPSNTAWIMVATAMVLFMTLPGLSLFYGGLVRTKNVLSILMQCLTIACIASLFWIACGYSLVFTEANSFIGSLDKAFFMGVTKESLSGDIPESLFALFQMTFVIIAPALMVGSFAERMRFSAVIAFASLWMLFIYAPVCHWVWGPGGWLAEMGVMDFAGGLVVHLTAGVAGLVAALLIKERKGFGAKCIAPHSMVITLVGAGMLWVGWFGFNGGSALGANSDAAMTMLVTHISASVATLVWMLLERIYYGAPSALGGVTGMVAGLATITPASGFVGPLGALIIGLLASPVCFTATHYMKQVLKIDDSLDVFPVHGLGGVLGSLMVAFFASNNLGAFSGYSDINIFDQFIVQLTGVAAVFAYTLVVSWGILKFISLFVNLRVSDLEETEGLDLVEHNESGYNY